MQFPAVAPDRTAENTHGSQGRDTQVLTPRRCGNGTGYEFEHVEQSPANLVDWGERTSRLGVGANALDAG